MDCMGVVYWRWDGNGRWVCHLEDTLCHLTFSACGVEISLQWRLYSSVYLDAASRSDDCSDLTVELLFDRCRCDMTCHWALPERLQPGSRFGTVLWTQQIRVHNTRSR